MSTDLASFHRWATTPLSELDFVSGTRTTEEDVDEKRTRGRWERALDVVF